MRFVVIRRRSVVVSIAAAMLMLHGAAQAQSPGAFDEALLQGIPVRNLGPFRMGARTAAIAVPDAPARAHQYTM